MPSFQEMKDECRAHPIRLVVGGPHDGRRMRVTFYDNGNYFADYTDDAAQPASFKPTWNELIHSVPFTGEKEK